MIHIQTVELTSSQSSIDFLSIPQDYDDLYLLASTRTDRSNYTGDLLSAKVNGLTTNQTSVFLQGTGSGVSDGSLSSLRILEAAASAATNDMFGNSSCYIANYSKAQTKVFTTDGVDENNGAAANQFSVASLWNDTSAITSLEIITLNATNILAGSKVSLYGITAGGDGTVSTA